VHELRLIGGRACLDFCNTVDPREGPRPREALSSYGDLVTWAERAGLVDAAEASSLLAEAGTRPAAAHALFEEALVLREALFRVFSSGAAREPVAAADLATLNGVLQQAAARARLTASGPGFAWSWSDDEHDLERPLWLVARSAADLLTSDELPRVRKCAGRACGWLFLDASKNRSRRWCSMESCGSRAKMRRLYARRRSGRAVAERAPEQVGKLG
jgi:predicted RNA-binding Zn ribbon-like protein